MEASFTERQLKMLHAALCESAEGLVGKAYRWSEIAALTDDLKDLLQFEREAKRERKKSLAIERRASRSP